MIRRKRDEALGMGSFMFGLLALLLAFGALIVAAQAFSRSNDAKSVASDATGTAVSLSEFKISPSVIAVDNGGSLTVKNAGTATHNLAVKDTSLKTPDIAPGSSAHLDLSSLKTGMYTAFGQIPGHAGAGMTAMLHVGLGGASGTATAGVSTAANDQADATMKKPVDTYVAQLKNGPNTEGVGNQLLAPKVLSDGTKEFDLTAKVTRLGGVTRQDRAGLDVQRHRSRPDDQGAAAATTCASCSTTSCRSRPRSTSTASRCRTRWTAFPTSPSPR